MNKWYEEAVFYHLYPLGLLGSKKVNDYVLERHFDELEKWLYHMKDLNITALYIGPLFKSMSHGYDTVDYYEVDPRLGTREDFKYFVKKAHELGIKVVVDGVFNHVGKAFFAFKDLLEKRENSYYRDWFYCDFTRQSPSGENFFFEAWHGYYELVKLNLDNPEVEDHLMGAVKYWIDEFDIDGIRLDCADCLSFKFLSDLRLTVDHKKADFWLMGELIHGDYSRWIKPELLNSSTNYELHKGLYNSHNDYNYFELAHSIKRQFDPMYGLYKGFYLYNFVDNHDVDRLYSKLKRKPNLKNVYVLLFALIGIPSIYYGSEYAIEGVKTNGSDDPLRPKLDLDKLKANETTKLITKLAKLKKEHRSLSYGKYQEVLLTNRQYAFLRYDENERLLCVANCDEAPSCFSINLEGIKDAYSLLDNKSYSHDQNTITIELRPHDSDLIKIS